jgi:ribosomal protein L33
MILNIQYTVWTTVAFFWQLNVVEKNNTFSDCYTRHFVSYKLCIWIWFQPNVIPVCTKKTSVRYFSVKTSRSVNKRLIKHEATAECLSMGNSMISSAMACTSEFYIVLRKSNKISARVEMDPLFVVSRVKMKTFLIFFKCYQDNLKHMSNVYMR